MQIVEKGINIYTLLSTEGLSGWMRAQLIMTVSESLSLLGTKNKCKVSTMVIMSSILLQ